MRSSNTLFSLSFAHTSLAITQIFGLRPIEFAMVLIASSKTGKGLPSKLLNLLSPLSAILFSLL